MTAKIVTIGGATAFVTDSSLGMEQFLAMPDPPRYLLFDMMSEGVIPYVARGAKAAGPAYVQGFVDLFVLPYLPRVMAHGIRLVANAGALDGHGCAAAIRDGAAREGLYPKVAVVDGDDLRGRAEEFVGRGFADMFSDVPIGEAIGSAELLSMSAYVGAFPIARALADGADIVVTGRAVDSAAALGPLIHEFGWTVDDFDRLAAGTLCGHLIECSAQVTGGTFTDWEEVPDWHNIGFPLAECRTDGGFILTKPPGTGGMVTPATCAEQLIYEVSDPRAYIVPDVVCDFSGVRFRQTDVDRVEVTGARGRGRTDSYKVSFTVDDGWRATTVFPIIGRDAVRKAERTGAELVARTERILEARQLGGWRRTCVEPLGGEATYGPLAHEAARTTREVVCRVVCDHDSFEGAEVLIREQASIISHMAPGISVPLANAITPRNKIGAFLLPKSEVALALHLGGRSTTVQVALGGAMTVAGPVTPPPPPLEDCNGGRVPLIALAYARSGDKGHVFNVGVMARKPDYLPAINAALTDEAVLDHYRHFADDADEVTLERYFMPGFHGINFVIFGCMQGGLMNCARADSAAKAMAQLLLDHPVPIPAAWRAEPDLTGWLID
jgi:hypothetical protein